MKSLFHPAIYLIATITSLGIMLIVDYLLGAEAEHLNAWVVLNKVLGNATTVGDSLAIRKLGLAGATALTVIVNFVFGFLLAHLISFIINIIHRL
ncbi:MAG: hypothetical protein R2800_02005 [Flavipsychrobacter sp.]